MARAPGLQTEQDGSGLPQGHEHHLAPDAQPQGKFPYLQNVRSYRGNQAARSANSHTALRSSGFQYIPASTERPYTRRGLEVHHHRGAGGGLSTTHAGGFRL